MEEHLKAVLANVNEWLKFAEAKNAAIIAADAAAAFGALTLLIGDNNPAFWLEIYLHSFIFFAALSAVTALFSVVPKTKILFSNSSEVKYPTDNLVFYGHIAKYTADEYLAALHSRYGSTEINNVGLELDYAQQIVVNSQITLRKYNLFRWSAWLALAAVLSPILVVILFLAITERGGRIKPRASSTINPSELQSRFKEPIAPIKETPPPPQA